MINRRSEQVTYEVHGQLIRESLYKPSCIAKWLRKASKITRKVYALGSSYRYLFRLVIFG